MLERLLVPLDGSGLAETVLPVAVRLAKQLPAQLTLLHVLEADPPAMIHGERHLTRPDEAEEYLARLGDRLRQQTGVQVDCRVHVAAQGRVARSIVEQCRAWQQDMVLIATHGSGGVRGFLWGSVAQQVLGEGEIPVMVVHAPPRDEGEGEVWPRTLDNQGEEGGELLRSPGSTGWQTVVVPLDGAERHETSLPLAAELARRFGVRLHLVRVIPQQEDLRGSEGTLRRFFPAATQALLQAEEQQAHGYLAGQARHWGQLAQISVTTEVRLGEPAAEIVTSLREQRADLVVMASHGHRGWQAFWAGRVTPRVMAHWDRPTLLVQAGPTPDRSL